LYVQSAGDPAFQALVGKMLKGAHQVMERFYDSFDIREKEYLNPDFTEIVEETNAGPASPIEGTTTEGNQISQAMRAVAGGVGEAGPLNPPGRPEAGSPRTNPQVAGIPG